MKTYKTRLVTLLLFSGLVVVPITRDSSKNDCECSYELTLGHGYSLIANHCDHQGGNHLDKIFPNVPEGSLLYPWDQKKQQFSDRPARYKKGHWAPNLKLNPGEGAFFYNPSEEPLTIQICGLHHEFVPPEIPKPGWYVLSMQEPAVGSYEEIVGKSPSEGDLVYRWDGNQWNVYEYLGDGGWQPEAPTIRIGEAVVIYIGSVGGAATE